MRYRIKRIRPASSSLIHNVRGNGFIMHSGLFKKSYSYKYGNNAWKKHNKNIIKVSDKDLP